MRGWPSFPKDRGFHVLRTVTWFLGSHLSPVQWLAILAYQGLVYLIPRSHFCWVGWTFVYLCLDPFCLDVSPLVSMGPLLLPPNWCSHSSSTKWLSFYWMPNVTSLMSSISKTLISVVDLSIHFFPSLLFGGCWFEQDWSLCLYWTVSHTESPQPQTSHGPWWNAHASSLSHPPPPFDIFSLQ